MAAAFRAASLPPPLAEQSALADEIARRVMGLGFLDLLLPPARTDLSEIAIYSSGLIQVMKKGSVRWEDAGLEVDAAEVWRVLNLVLGPQSRAANEATPSVNAKLPATRHNPGGGRVKVLHPVIAPGKGYPSVNIRLFEQKPVRPEWLLERGMMSPEMMAFLGTCHAGRCAHPDLRGDPHRQDHPALGFVQLPAGGLADREDRGPGGDLDRPQDRPDHRSPPEGGRVGSPGLHPGGRRGRCHAHVPRLPDPGRGARRATRPWRCCGP